MILVMLLSPLIGMFGAALIGVILTEPRKVLFILVAAPCLYMGLNKNQRVRNILTYIGR